MLNITFYWDLNVWNVSQWSVWAVDFDVVLSLVIETLTDPAVLTSHRTVPCKECDVGKTLGKYYKIKVCKKNYFYLYIRSTLWYCRITAKNRIVRYVKCHCPIICPQIRNFVVADVQQFEMMRALWYWDQGFNFSNLIVWNIKNPDLWQI